ncbi:universal stress protein [Echinicola marina]|uniref:universal stress protein n=1 Tax=Echinicola marina TaxID=2859768 RepID=UPI001CF61BCC|nr:universal stress protein [Echinicola marina]UCS95593.1 universal stress protein [Echinicola marina]
MKILLATDFSENAQNAFQFAKELAKAHHGKLGLLFAYTPVFDFAAQLAEYIVAIENQAKKEMEKLKKEAKKEGLKISYLITQETASSAICSEAKKQQYDLVIVGTSGESKISQAFLGTTTTEVIKHCPKPVLCIPPEAQFKNMNTISMAMELNREDISFLGQLITLTKGYKLPYKIIHIKDKAEIPQEITFFELSAYLKDRFPELTISYEEIAAKEVNEGLQKYAEKHPQTLLSMFTQHRTFFDYLFNKSHSAELALHTTVPLLVLKSQSRK